MNRRNLIKGLSISSLSAAGIGAVSASEAGEKKKKSTLPQSLMCWCYKQVEMEELLKFCVKIGIKAVEGLNPKHYPLAKKLGLEIALVNAHHFSTGPVDK